MVKKMFRSSFSDAGALEALLSKSVSMLQWLHGKQQQHAGEKVCFIYLMRRPCTMGWNLSRPFTSPAIVMASNV